MKKPLSILLSAAVLLLCLPLGAMPAVAATGGTTGDCTWTLDGTTLTVSGNGAMGNYFYFDSPSPWGTEIQEVIIEDGVTSVGRYAFYACRSLKRVTLGNDVAFINDYAFEECNTLEWLTFGDSLDTIGAGAFSNCYSLSSLTLPDSLTFIGTSAFAYCEYLDAVTIPDSVSCVEDRAFYHSGLYDDPTNWTDGVLYIGDYLIEAKETCPASYAIRQGTRRIAELAFSNCKALTSVVIPGDVAIINNGAFRGCYSLTEVIYCGPEEQWDAITVGQANTVLTDASRTYHSWQDATCTLPKHCAFCGETEGDALGHTFVDGVCSVCQTHEAPQTSGEYTYSVTEGKATITTVDTALSGAVTIPSTLGGYPVTAIGEQAFANSTGLTSVTIPEGVTTIGRQAFFICGNLTSVNIPDSVTVIEDFAFSNCYALSSVSIPENVTHIGYNAFFICYSLTTITVEPSNAAYCDVDGVLFNKDKSKMLRYPPAKAGSVYTVPDGTTSIGHYAFSDCSALASVTIPDSVTDIGSGAFRDCSVLTSLTLPKGVTTIRDGMFSNSGLTSITIPEGVTAIYDNAFSSCSSLVAVTIPDSVVSVWNYAFFNCRALASVTYCGTAAQWDAIAIGSSNDAILNATRSYHSRKDGGCTACGRTVDVDGNGSVTTNDAVLLLYHTLLPDQYPLDSLTDVDGSGTVNEDDAVYLLYYCLLPDQYPL